VLSHAGELGIAVIVDADSWPDLDVLLQEIVVGFAELGCSGTPPCREATMPTTNSAMEAGHSHGLRS
jgi:hypothetical protein